MKTPSNTITVSSESTKQLQALLAQILALNESIASVNWNESEVKDVKLGEHMERLEHYLDCAVGRASGLVCRSRELSRKATVAS